MSYASFFFFLLSQSTAAFGTGFPPSTTTGSMAFNPEARPNFNFTGGTVPSFS